MLHEKVSPQTLGFARITVYGIWFWHVVKDPLSKVAEVPFESFSPIGVLQLVPQPLWRLIYTTEFLSALKLTMLVGLALLVLGVGPFRCIAILTCILLTFYQGLIRGFGYINHGELPILYSAYVLAVFPSAHAVSLRRGEVDRAPPVMYQAPMITAALLLCLTYTFVGARRLAEGGLEIFSNGTIIYMIALRSFEPGPSGSGYGHLVLEHPWLALMLQVGFPVVTAFELLSPLCLFYRGFRRAWLVAIFAFHLMTGLFMQIWFTANFLLILVFLTDIDRLRAAWLPHQVRGNSLG
jgi:hypothetical protein